MRVDRYAKCDFASFITVRERKGEALLYVGKDNTLHSAYIPVSTPLRSYQVLGTYLPRLPDIYIPLAVVDNKGAAHVFIYHTQENKSVDLEKHFVFDDMKYEKSYLASSNTEHRFVFAGEGEDGNLYLRVIKGKEDVPKTSNKPKKIEAEKGTVRIALTQSAYGVLYVKTRENEHRLLTLGDMRRKPTINTDPADVKVTSASSHIELVTSRAFDSFVGDDGIYEVRYKQHRNRSFVLIDRAIDYPLGMSPENIQKILLEAGIEDQIIALLLTKDGVLWGWGTDNISNILGNYKTPREWQVLQKDVADIYPVGGYVRGVLVRTKDNKMYYRGANDRKSGSNFYMPVGVDGDVENALIADDLKTYVCSVKKGVVIDGKFHNVWYSYFLDTNDNYVRGEVTSVDLNDKVVKWVGDVSSMQDIMTEHVLKPSILFSNLC